MAAAIVVALAALTWHFNAPPRHEALSAVPDTLRALLATVVLFGLGGFGLVRMLSPPRCVTTSSCGCCPPEPARSGWR